jgi:hypothetical protein
VIPSSSPSYIAKGGEGQFPIALQRCSEREVVPQISPCAFVVHSVVETRRLLPAIDNKVNDQPEVQIQTLRSELVDFDILRTWMTECEQRHGEDCCLATEDVTTLPGFKVIDCINNGVVPFPPKAEYVALSYVWGQSTDRTGEDTSSVPTRMAISAPISRLHLPRTIQDAMEVVTKLGLRYLWVDKYCIDQTNVMELRHQISAMDKIYQNATVTVIAELERTQPMGYPEYARVQEHRSPNL